VWWNGLYCNPKCQVDSAPPHLPSNRRDSSTLSGAHRDKSEWFHRTRIHTILSWFWALIWVTTMFYNYIALIFVLLICEVALKRRFTKAHLIEVTVGVVFSILPMGQYLIVKELGQEILLGRRFIELDEYRGLAYGALASSIFLALWFMYYLFSHLRFLFNCYKVR
jgi:hypothetical protein